MIFTPLFVIFLIVVFVLVWLFANTIDKRKWLSFLISLALTPIVYFYMFYPLINIFSSYHHQKHFDAAAWEDKPAYRYEMSDEITSEKLFIGTTKKEVQSILGTSEWYSWDDSIKANTPEKWNYNLGYKPGAFNLTQECLELEFKNNKVASIKQYQLETEFEKAP
ncbi:MAG: type IV secretory pathway VirB6-like protein [Mariniflexile sp.]|jgi:type IV secretory pathway VirB6-like protein